MRENFWAWERRERKGGGRKGGRREGVERELVASLEEILRRGLGREERHGNW